MRFNFVIIALVIIVTSSSAFAGEALFYKEVNLMAGYSDRDKWIGRDSSLVNSVGFEDYRKFSNQYGDYLTTDLQVRLSYDSLRNSQDAWAIEIHNAWLEYKDEFDGSSFSPEAGEYIYITLKGYASNNSFAYMGEIVLKYVGR